MNMEPLIPHVLLEDEDYKIFLELISTVHDDIKEMISKFPELVDIDNAPEIFLPKLSALLNYNYRHDIPEDIQREIIKRILAVYRARGSDDSIIMAATYGDDPYWVGSHLFLPGADTNKFKAKIMHPSTQLFRHSRSKHSGLNRFADSIRWTAGTLIIQVTYVNDKIRQAIQKVVPAGLKVYFDIISNPEGSGELDELIFGEWQLLDYYEIHYDSQISDLTEAARFDLSSTKSRRRSGRQLLRSNRELEFYRGVSTISKEATLLQELVHSLDYQIDGIRISNNYSGKAIRSTSKGKRSSKYPMSGSYTGEISFCCSIEDVIPSDRWYPVSAVANLRINEYLQDYCTSVEVIKQLTPVHSTISESNLTDSVELGNNYLNLGELSLIDSLEGSNSDTIVLGSASLDTPLVKSKILDQ